MLNKFLSGLVFGAGFTVAVIIIAVIGMNFILPRVITSSLTETKRPDFKNPREAKVLEPEPKGPTETKDFNFFKQSGERMKIPKGGGILAMSPITTRRGAKRPSTYQLWLTESKLWQIRTTEEKAEIEELPYPQKESVSDLNALMSQKLGGVSRQSTMTVSSYEIATLKSSGNSGRDGSLNGMLRISVEGVVFVIPNPYET